jgi:formate--tetrahydrofolate ligase
VIVTLKALRAQCGARDGSGTPEQGYPNLQRHLENLRRWGVPAVVAMNRFPGDSDEELARLRAFCASLGVTAALSEGYARGGDGMLDLADAVVEAVKASDPDAVRPLYSPDQPLDAKIKEIVTKVYGAGQVQFKPAARARLQQFTALGFGRLPVCIAKTQYSFTDDPKVMGAPSGWTLTISEVTLSAGAGFVVAIAGSMMLMPGLGKNPQAHTLDVDDQGNIVGMEY